MNWRDPINAVIPATAMSMSVMYIYVRSQLLNYSPPTTHPFAASTMLSFALRAELHFGLMSAYSILWFLPFVS